MQETFRAVNGYGNKGFSKIIIFMLWLLFSRQSLPSYLRVVLYSIILAKFKRSMLLGKESVNAVSETTGENGKKCDEDGGSYFNRVCLILGAENYCPIGCLRKNSKFLECLSQSTWEIKKKEFSQDEGKTLHIL